MPRNQQPAKAHDSAAPPSLLSIRIHAEKESDPALLPIGRFTITRTFKIFTPIPSTTYNFCPTRPQRPSATLCIRRPCPLTSLITSRIAAGRIRKRSLPSLQSHFATHAFSATSIANWLGSLILSSATPPRIRCPAPPPPTRPSHFTTPFPSTQIGFVLQFCMQ